jgi:hypothetical protein
MAITLLIAFLYGGLVWGIFPQLFPHQPISWESHLMGLLAGAILAVYYRNSGPQSKVYDWENEEEEGEDENENENENEEENNDQGPDDTGQSGGPGYRYEYKE